MGCGGPGGCRRGLCDGAARETTFFSDAQEAGHDRYNPSHQLTFGGESGVCRYIPSNVNIVTALAGTARTRFVPIPA